MLSDMIHSVLHEDKTNTRNSESMVNGRYMMVVRGRYAVEGRRETS